MSLTDSCKNFLVESFWSPFVVLCLLYRVYRTWHIMACRRQRCHQGKPDDTPVPKHFGDSITAGHTFTAREEPPRKGETVALVIRGRASHWIQAFASKTKSAHETSQGFQCFMGGFKPKLTYTDGSKAFEKACEELGYCHDMSTPYRAEINGVAERAVRQIKEGTSCALDQSGLNHQWWPEAMMCFLGI